MDRRPAKPEQRAGGRTPGWQEWFPGCASRGYAIIITADHGQHDVQNKNGKTSGQHGSDSDIDCLVPLVWLRGSSKPAAGAVPLTHPTPL